MDDQEPHAKPFAAVNVPTFRFNVFNWVNFGIPVFTMTDPNFGKIQTANPPRIVQLGVRYSF